MWQNRHSANLQGWARHSEVYHDVGVKGFSPSLHVDDIGHSWLQSTFTQVSMSITELELEASAEGFQTEDLPSPHISISTIVGCSKLDLISVFACFLANLFGSLNAKETGSNEPLGDLSEGSLEELKWPWIRDTIFWCDSFLKSQSGSKKLSAPACSHEVLKILNSPG